MSEPTSSPRPFSEQMARNALESVRLLVEERGWDAPFSVYGLRCAIEDVRIVLHVAQYPRQRPASNHLAGSGVSWRGIGTQ